MTNKNNNNYFINVFLIAVYLLILVLTAQFMAEIDSTSVSTNFFTLYVWLSYSFYYLLPTFFIAKTLLFLYHRYASNEKILKFIFATILLISILTLLFLYSDYYLYNLYGYHIDSFVINLIMTPGGIESLGVTNATIQTMTIQVVFFISAMLGFFYILHQQIIVKEKRFFEIKIKARSVLWLFLLFFALEEVSHGVLASLGEFEIVSASSTFPLNLNTTFNSFLKRSGFKPASSVRKMSHGKVKYPSTPLVYKADSYKTGSSIKTNKPNIVWLVAESLRWDMLTPEIMPKTWAYSEQNLRFNRHYSGGNRTRMGLFSMFYGLYAPYWYTFEEQRISSPILDALMAQGYQLQINTSQSFTYPELNNTIFVNVPKEDMQALNEDPDTWRRDEQNITDIISAIKNRDVNKPFFSFMFFEATHAPYQFPESSAIRKEYIEEMNYAKLNLRNNIGLIKNRYINASHYVDSQVGRLLEALKAMQLDNNTIVIITGDHGEEFMEKGHWGHGHNAVFPEEQIRVPMVMAIPGEPARSINYLTSHLDIPATILPLIGVLSAPESYSFGQSLLTDHRKFFVAGNYNYLSYIDEKYKLTFPFTGKSANRIAIRTANDKLVTKAESIIVAENYKSAIDKIYEQGSQFICKDC
ncbi:sulfatase-like hydrolase/transferase [sulfur-oxidizing endosymbiont of Gigantopelta aegis]|uniref:sulfatase-like hydrolase/transferase n=1 Tax=sulfur-oxidizing endosymbiont of Gigantopelta aegis TaxID=2794934 RepID=UPI0018DE09BA|nr:sulfatase-like hydrolase/transferase [sulfur-oxidizing endosymbiont of Gigantopelta aegis]